MECATSDITTNSQTDIILHGYRPRKFFYVRQSPHRQRSAARSQPKLRSRTASVYQHHSPALVYTLLYTTQNVLVALFVVYDSSFLAKK